MHAVLHAVPAGDVRAVDTFFAECLPEVFLHSPFFSQFSELGGMASVYCLAAGGKKEGEDSDEDEDEEGREEGEEGEEDEDEKIQRSGDSGQYQPARVAALYIIDNFMHPFDRARQAAEEAQLQAELRQETDLQYGGTHPLAIFEQAPGLRGILGLGAGGVGEEGGPEEGMGAMVPDDDAEAAFHPPASPSTPPSPPMPFEQPTGLDTSAAQLGWGDIPAAELGGDASNLFGFGGA